MRAAFAFQQLPHLSGESAAVPDSSAARHALMAVAFAERAANDGRTVQRSLDGHLEAFISHAGQFRRQGAYSLRGLLTSAGEIATKRGILPQTRDNLRVLIASARGDDNRLASAEGAL